MFIITTFFFKITELRKIKEDINKQLNFNDDIKLHLYEVRSSIFQRLHKTYLELEKQMEKNQKLEDKMINEIKLYQKNTEDKDEQVKNKIRRIESLQQFVSRA